MILKKKLLLLACSFIVLLAVSDFTSAKSKGVKINKKKFNISMKVGDELKIKHTKLDAKKVKWKSANKSVATVSSKGVLKAKKVGKTTINAKSGKVKVTGKVKVKAQKKPTATPQVTVQPTVQPTIQPTVQPTSAPTPRPTRTPKPTPIPTATPKRRVSGDLAVKFFVSQEKLTKETKIISGYVRAQEKTGVDVYDWKDKFGDVLVTLKVEDAIIAEQIVTEEKEGAFSFKEDLSKYEVDTRILIQTRPTWNLFSIETEDWIYDYLAHGWYENYFIEE